jgi:hypothetical protein
VSSATTHSTKNWVKVLPTGLPKWTNYPDVTHLCPTFSPRLGRPGHTEHVRASNPDTYRHTCHSQHFIFILIFNFSFLFLTFFSREPPDASHRAPEQAHRWRRRPSELVLPPPLMELLLPPLPAAVHRSSSSILPPEILLSPLTGAPPPAPPTAPHQHPACLTSTRRRLTSRPLQIEPPPPALARIDTRWDPVSKEKGAAPGRRGGRR